MTHEALGRTLREQDRSIPHEDPYIRQCVHFLRVVRGEVSPMITAAESTRSQIVTAAIAEAAVSGHRIDLAERFAAFERMLACSHA